MLRKITTLLEFSFTAILFCALTACGSNRDDLDAYLEETRAQPGGKLDPLPSFTPPEPFVYAASGLRSPFQRPLRPEEEKLKVIAEAPDPTRPKEVLENFSIDQVSMVGTMQGQDTKLWAVVADGAGGVYRVAEGNYLGRNFGKIKQVYVDKIDVVEVVPDGRGGWLERPRTIELKQK
jgi:type IV pilus assembly protein PilP